MTIHNQGFIRDFVLGRGKNQSCEGEGVRSGMLPPGKFLKYQPSEVASGGFCLHRRLVAEMLLHVEIQVGRPPPCCMKP